MPSKSTKATGRKKSVKSTKKTVTRDILVKGKKASPIFGLSKMRMGEGTRNMVNDAATQLASNLASAIIPGDITNKGTVPIREGHVATLFGALSVMPRGTTTVPIPPPSSKRISRRPSTKYFKTEAEVNKHRYGNNPGLANAHHKRTKK